MAGTTTDSIATRRFVMPIVGLGETFYLAPLTAPEQREAFAAVGFTDVIMDYLVGRVAPMGRIPAEVAIAALFMFHPDGVRPAIPGAWDLAPPERVFEIKVENADIVLRRILGEWVSSPEAKEAADIARAACERCEIAGRPIAAGLAAQGWQPDPHMVLWHAFCFLREFRGDTHNAALTAAGLNGAEAQQLMVFAGSAGCDCHRSFTTNWGQAFAGAKITRYWPDDAWADATDRLRRRGIIDDDRAITPAGMELHLDIERQTDEATRAAGDTSTDAARLGELLQHPAALLRASVAGGMYDEFNMNN